MLLHSSVEENVSVVSIIGIGGLGKTTLAKLVYNDDIIQTEFPLKMWVCISDDFNVTSLLGQILAAATKGTDNGGLNKDQLKTKLRRLLSTEKYFLVLDDVWNEDPIKWDELRNVLIQGVSGSKIIVTTRSNEVAKIVGCIHQSHELKGLSEEESWNLFERTTLAPGQLRMEAHLVEIGKDIVRKCANVPLALRVTGSLLRGQGDSTWRNLRNSEAQIDEKGGIIPVLKISYHHLPLHLKSCFSYCAVFPKDHQIVKDDLIDQWMAHGFITPLSEQSLEDLGDMYFNKLLKRCFFQDVVRSETTGNIIRCKMHDLIHDLAKAVSRTGIDIDSLQDDNTRHIFIDDTVVVGMEDFEWYLRKMKKLRTCLVRQRILASFYSQFPFNLRNLRVLDLSGEFFNRGNIEKLPSIGELMIHLRYLDLTHNRELCMLPDSITQLYNLQTLKLEGCRGLKELPREFSKLVNLRHLDIGGCYGLKHMPGGMNRMTNLHRLTRFVVGDVGMLEDLKDLNNLRDGICIKIRMKDGWTYDAEKVKEGGYLINKPLLSNICIRWDGEPSSNNGEDAEEAKALLQGLQLHPNIKQLRLIGYPGVGFPRWGNYSLMNFSDSLPNLVDISLIGCTRLESVPLLSQLRHLKFLQLRTMMKLEYVESSICSGDDDLLFFPSLTKLELSNLPELKGWWKPSRTSSSSSTQPALNTTISTSGEGGEIGRVDVNQSNNSNELPPSLFLEFPCLSMLDIHSCKKLTTTIPGFPKLKEMMLFDSNMLLEHLHSLPRESFHHLSRMQIFYDDKIERLSTLEVFQSGRLYSLRSFTIENCTGLKSISGRRVWEHFTALETLKLRDLPELELELEWEEEDVNKGEMKEEDNGRNDDEDEDMPWRWVAPTLRHLILIRLPHKAKMLKGMQHLTSLRTLDIYFPGLAEIPDWVGCFSSLQQLSIGECSRVKSLPEEMRHLTCLTHLMLYICSKELEERCEDPNGVDWPKIKHIPHFYKQ